MGPVQTKCRECHAKARRAHYEADRERYTDLEATRVAVRGLENRLR